MLSMSDLSEFSKVSFFGISVYQALLSFLILFLTMTMRRLIIGSFIRMLERYAEKSKTEWDNSVIQAIRPPLEVLILAYGIWLAVKILPQPTEPVDIKHFVNVIGEVLILLLGAWLLLRLVDVADKIIKQKAADPKHWLDISIAPLITASLRILVVITSLIVIAQNLGYSVSGLVASLGLGGAAIALASKDTLSNLFGSMMIMVDKPFKVGDWIKGADFEGVVEEIGFRSTRIRTFGKTVENIPNNMIANVKVENMDRRKDKGYNVRRIKMTVGVSYSATADQMEKAVESLREILKTDPGVDQRMTTLVYFTDFGASSLDIFLYFFSNSAVWAEYLEVRQRVNLKIMKKLEVMGLSIAFPSRSVYIESMPDNKSSGSSQDG
ncbi:MAG TPA: mechanosensitive ion channel family protein [Nitrospirae bacterium]|nr:mechanosensitive ion channel family protein [Nitrospirota bacterium]